MKVYDSDIRNLLFEKFLHEDEYIKEETVIVNEMDVCSGISRVDIAVVNGKLHGFEIKSGQDTLDRLPQQIESYNQVFDTMTIVTHQNHLDDVKCIVPKWWGIQCIYEKKESIVLKSIRKGKLNHSINIKSVAMLLWREEMLDLLNGCDNIKLGYKSKSRIQLSELIECYISEDKVKEFVRNRLKYRQGWRAVSLQILDDGLHNMIPIEQSHQDHRYHR